MTAWRMRTSPEDLHVVAKNRRVFVLNCAVCRDLISYVNRWGRHILYGISLPVAPHKPVAGRQHVNSYEGWVSFVPASFLAFTLIPDFAHMCALTRW